ncbi:MAG: Planctomycete cytochrome, partial [Verrucomicrobiaceae bacterium]|nr:Planctomycete cytochrome [Verrucomicrobiaceae bacterium]
GPSAKPYQPARYWENLNFPAREYQNDTGEGLYRRGLYTWWQRSFLHPSLLAFDAPSREECTAERNRSNIPQQALVLLNDPTYVEAARAFAARILTECKGTTEERLRWAWQTTLQRDPTAAENKTLNDLLSDQIKVDPAGSDSINALLKTGDSSIPLGIDKAELAAWAHVARVLLNLHETITRS